MMIKLLINDVTGEQKIEYVSQSGGYFDDSRVLWDERHDGAIPSGVELGKMTRIDKSLVKQNSYITEHQLWLDDKNLKDAEENRVSLILQEIKSDPAIQAIKNMSASQIDSYFSSNITTLPQAISILKKLIKILIKHI